MGRRLVGHRYLVVRSFDQHPAMLDDVVGRVAGPVVGPFGGIGLGRRGGQGDDSDRHRDGKNGSHDWLPRCLNPSGASQENASGRNLGRFRSRRAQLDPKFGEAKGNRRRPRSSP
jgi:hypothetical protein